MSDKKSMRFSDRNGIEVNMIGLGKVFGVDAGTIKSWVDKGMPHAGGKGRQYIFDSAECVRWRMNRECESIEAKIYVPVENEIEMSINEAKRRKEVANALSAELDLAKERDQLANIEDLVTAFEDALVNVRANLVSMSSRLSGILSHQETDSVGKLLDAEVDDILEHLCKYKREI